MCGQRVGPAGRIQEDGLLVAAPSGRVLEFVPGLVVERGGVDVVAGRQLPVGKHALVPTLADDPFSRKSGFHPPGDEVRHLLDRGGRADVNPVGLFPGRNLLVTEVCGVLIRHQWDSSRFNRAGIWLRPLDTIITRGQGAEEGAKRRSEWCAELNRRPVGLIAVNLGGQAEQITVTTGYLAFDVVVE